MKLTRIFLIGFCIIHSFGFSIAATTYFLAKEVKREIDTGKESLMHFVLEKVEFSEDKIVTTSMTHSQWGCYPLTLIMEISPNNSFTVKNETFAGSGKVFGERGKLSEIQYTDSCIKYSGDKFLGSYHFHDDQVVAQKSWYDMNGTLQYFSIQTGKYITAEQFDAFFKKPDEMPQFWDSL